MDENYWDQQMNADFLSSLQAHGLTRDSGTRARVTVGDGTIEVKAWKAGKIVLRVSARSDVVIEAGQFYFPTWRASVDGHSSDELGPMAPNGLLALHVPRGEHEVRFSIEEGPEERVGAIVSGVSLGVLLLVGVALYRSPSPRTARRDS